MSVEEVVSLNFCMVLTNLRQERRPLNILDFKVQILRILKCTNELYDEWAEVATVLSLLWEVTAEAGQILEDVALVDDVIDVLHRGHVFFLQLLQSDPLLPLLVECFVHLRKVASSENLPNLKVFDAWFQFIRVRVALLLALSDGLDVVGPGVSGRVGTFIVKWSSAAAVQTVDLLPAVARRFLHFF